MTKLTRDEVVLALSAALLIQSVATFSLAVLKQRAERDADKYADIVRYYNDVLERNEVELEEYDLIALNTMFDERDFQDE